MGDDHVCSFCNENQVGKQHIKIVFENWPVEEEIIYRRKGKEARKTNKVTKEVITALGMECINNPERWKEFDIDPSKVADFFEDLRFIGKNPYFRAVVAEGIDKCLAIDCPHVSLRDETCRHLIRLGFPYTGLDELHCAVGHPGVELVRHKESAITPGSWKSFRLWWANTPYKGYWIALLGPFLIAWFIIYPFWWLKAGLKKVPLKTIILRRL